MQRRNSLKKRYDVYTFADFGNSTETSAGTIRFQALQGSELTAYTPYLVGKNLSKSTTNFTFSRQDADFPATPSPIATSSSLYQDMDRSLIDDAHYDPDYNSFDPFGVIRKWSHNEDWD